MKAAVVTAADKAIDEKRELGKLYRARQRHEFDKACSGLDGKQIKSFATTLRRFTIDDADAMIAFVTREAATWLRAAPEDIRALALRLIDNRIIAIRERADLVPFDDPMPWQEETVFLICKRELGL